MWLCAACLPSAIFPASGRMGRAWHSPRSPFNEPADDCCCCLPTAWHGALSIGFLVRSLKEHLGNRGGYHAELYGCPLCCCCGFLEQCWVSANGGGHPAGVRQDCHRGRPLLDCRGAGHQE